MFFSKDTIHPILKLQSSTANDPFPNDIGVLLWFGFFFLALLYCAFLETWRDIRETGRQHFDKNTYGEDLLYTVMENVLQWLSRKLFNNNLQSTIISPLMQDQTGHVLYLNPFLIAGSLDNPMDVDAGYVDVLCSKGPNIYHLLHLQGTKL